MSEERWLFAWYFLSLDRVRPFFPELWVRLETEDACVAEVRGVLEPALALRGQHQPLGSVHYRLAEWFTGTYGRDGYSALKSWVFRILLRDGTDRGAETAWSSLVQHLGKEETNSNDWIRAHIHAVRTTRNEVDDRLEAKMESHRAGALSEWDSHVLPFYSFTAEAMDRKVGLICSYNNLLLAWDQFMAGAAYDQLLLLDQRARTIAPTVGWREEDVPFPGNWMFDLDDLIQAAKTGRLIRRTRHQEKR
jgi:hypothetical protein